MPTGHRQSKETREKLRKINLGKKHALGTRRKMSISGKKRFKENPPIGPKNSAWKGGKHKDQRGYVLIYSPTHPYAYYGRYVLEHRLIMEAHMGRVLLPTEIVHHVNGVRDDNRIENLMLFASKRDHAKHHQEIRRKEREKKKEKS